MTFARKTLSSPVVFEGHGLHTGVPVKVTVHPGEEGIWFRSGSDRLQAIPENVTDTTRSTRLGPVGTIEHLMSALASLEITDAEVEVEGGEMPALDGSSAEFLSAMAPTDVGEAEIPPLFTRIFDQGDNGLKIAIGKGSGHWRYVYDLGDRWPGEQSIEVESVLEAYASEIAPARTIVLTEEIEIARKHGLGRGLNESSVLILGPQGYENEARFPDEPARHKLLDLIGDLYLAGVPIRMLNVVAERTGHKANVHAAGMLRKAVFGS